MEESFLEGVVGEKARLFCSSAVERLKVARAVRELPATRAGHVILFMDSILKTCLIWLNELFILRGMEMRRLGLDDMYQYVAVLLLSHCTGFSFSKTIAMLLDCGCSPPSLERVRFISTHILAYSPTYRGDLGSTTWNAQRDQTPYITQFERTAFRDTCKVFFTPMYMFATLDDDLYGTRAIDNQVKSLSYRKADGEGHLADAVADSFFRVTLMVRFRRRGESQFTNVRNLIADLLDSRGEQSMHGCIFTADRGYGKMSLLRELKMNGIGSLLVMPEHLLYCHPFVGLSFMRLNRYDEEEGEKLEGAEGEQRDFESDVTNMSGSARSVPVGTVDRAAEAGITRTNTTFDRPRAFVINDSPDAAPAAYFATRNLTISEGRETGRSRVTALAVRERGTTKFSHIIRFMYSIPSDIAQRVENWVAVPHSGSSSRMIFGKRSDDGRIVRPSSLSLDYRDTMERFLLSKCIVLTVGQRCADWFVLRQFRVTGTNAGMILLAATDIRSSIGLPARSVDPDTSLAGTLGSLTRSWFSTARSTEPMMRGRANEGAVLASLSRRPFVKSIYECGMLAKADAEWLACSPDGVALIDVEDLCFDSGSSSPPNLSLASVEIKTSVSRASMDRALALATVDTVTCTVGDQGFREYIPECHMGQILHQLVVLSVNYVIYVSAGEAGIMYIVVVHCSDAVRELCKSALDRIAKPAVFWAYEENPQVPPFADPASAVTLRGRLSFWKIVYNHVKENDAFPPLKLFKHGTQSLYSKTKGGVDGSAQARAILRSSTSSLKWEQKIVSQTLKTLAINAFIAWRMAEKESLLQSKEAFGSLEKFRASLNKVQSLADFIHDVSRELLAHAEILKRTDGLSEEDETMEVTADEIVHLRALAVSRKKKRIPFFNGSEGARLRLQVRGHEQKQQAQAKYCSLCGNNTDGWRGHRTTFKCSHCDVHLCVRTYPGLRKSCWDVWHSTKELKPRKTQRPFAARLERPTDSTGSLDHLESPEQQEISKAAMASSNRRPTATRGRTRKCNSEIQRAPCTRQQERNEASEVQEPPSKRQRARREVSGAEETRQRRARTRTEVSDVREPPRTRQRTRRDRLLADSATSKAIGTRVRGRPRHP